MSEQVCKEFDVLVKKCYSELESYSNVLNSFKKVCFYNKINYGAKNRFFYNFWKRFSKRIRNCALQVKIRIPSFLSTKNRFSIFLLAKKNLDFASTKSQQDSSENRNDFHIMATTLTRAVFSGRSSHFYLNINFIVL